MSSSNIVITEKFYINYSIRSETDYDADTKTHTTTKTRLGYATYHEDSVAFQKRKASIDKWADKDDAGDTVNNVPRTGYTFGDMQTHGGGRWSSVSTVWRIIDPMGFELEISSGNMAEVIRYCTIDKGTILDECVWGWDKNSNSKVVLIPVASDVYQDAKKSTTRHFAEVIDPKEAQPGDMVEYKNGQMGLYFGKLNMLKLDRRRDYDEPGEFCKLQQEYVHVLMMEDKVMHFMKSPKIVTCSKSDKRYTYEEAEVYLNECFKDSDYRKDGSGYSYYYADTFTYDKKIDATLHLNEVSRDYVTAKLRSKWVKGGHLYHGHMDLADGDYVMELKDGTRCLFDGPAHEVLGSGRRHIPTEEFFDGLRDDFEFEVTIISNNDYEGTNVGIKQTLNPQYTSGYSYNRPSRFLRRKITLSDVVKFSKIEVHWKDQVFALAK